MIDYYKILNLRFGASDEQIKSSFRNLARKYHPDKNAGSLQYEEDFKAIVNAYEILSDKEKRSAYDIKYKTYYSNRNTTQTITNKPKYPQTNQKNNSNRLLFGIIIILIVLTYYYTISKKSTTGNPKADKELDQQPSERPESGELNFEDKN